MTVEANATVFETPNTVPPTVVTPPAAPEAPTLVALVGEGKKFRTVEDLAKSKLESDTFINKLQEEMKEIRKDLTSALRTNEAIEALKEGRNHSDTPAPSVSPEDIGKMVNEALTRSQQDKIAMDNVRASNDYLVTKLGGKDEAVAFLETKSKELGIPVEWFKDMAAKSPKALYNTLGVDAPSEAPPKGTTKGDVNTMALKNQNPGVAKGSKAEFDALRKANPGEYWKPAIQNAIFDSQRKGTY